jgi:hypothetical protein
VLVLVLPGAATADSDPEPESESPTPVVSVDGGRVTVDVQGAPLEEVLGQIAARGGFRLKTAGPLGPVTIAFANLSLERALRRLVRDHELMLVYGAAPAGEGSRLVEVSVFAASPSRSAQDRPGPAAVRERAALFSEIDRLGRERGAPRLAELLRGAPDPSVRARAATTLGRVGGAEAAAALTAALSDQTPSVRIQAAHALRSAEGPRAIPAIGDVLLSDPDVSVRRAAVRILGTLPDPAATAALSRAAADSDAQIRHDVSRTLQRRGVSAPR